MNAWARAEVRDLRTRIFAEDKLHIRPRVERHTVQKLPRSEHLLNAALTDRRPD